MFNFIAVKLKEKKTMNSPSSTMMGSTSSWRVYFSRFEYAYSEHVLKSNRISAWDPDVQDPLVDAAGIVSPSLYLFQPGTLGCTDGAAVC